MGNSFNQPMSILSRPSLCLFSQDTPKMLTTNFHCDILGNSHKIISYLMKLFLDSKVPSNRLRDRPAIDHRVSNTNIKPVSQLKSFWENVEESTVTKGNFIRTIRVIHTLRYHAPFSFA